MFAPERWAEAFVNALDEGGASAEGAAEAGLEVFKALAEGVRGLPGGAFGWQAAKRVYILAAEAESASGFAGREAKIAAGFLALLAERNLLKQTSLIIKTIEGLLEKQNGILAVSIETVFPPDEDFLEDLRQRIKSGTGAEYVKVETRIVPELIGGYRLRIGSRIIDASLISQVKLMEADLSSAGIGGEG
jgi:F-type H+-transporting ATPase subunit delta